MKLHSSNFKVHFQLRSFSWVSRVRYNFNILHFDIMAILKTIYRYRYGVVSLGILECLLFSAVVYGWASLAFVLKEESFFCTQHFSNLTINESSEDCSGQDDLLNLAFTIGVFSFTSFGVFAGALLDSCGPRVTRLTAS